MLKTLARGVIVTLLAGSALCAPAFAQGGGAGGAAQVDVRPPAPADPGKPNPMVAYALVFVLAGAAIALSVMPSQRTHQD